MDASKERIATDVQGAAGRLTRATRALADLVRRKEFERELHERGSWLVNGKPPADPPDWVKRWSEYWDGLKENPEYRRLQEEARAAREALHTPEFEEAIERLALGDATAAEYGVAYLEADPWYFRSGYLKGRIARWLRQVELSEGQRERLRSAVVAAIRRGSRYEQVEYRKLGRRLDTAAFREELRSLTRHKDRGVARRAGLALAACEANDTPGRDLRGAR